MEYYRRILMPALYFYTALSFFVCFCARFLPWDAVILHVIANLLSETAWMPLAVFVSYRLIVRVGEITLFKRTGTVPLPARILIIACAIIIVVITYETAWKLLPPVLIVMVCVDLTGKKRLHVSLLLPFALTAVIFLLYYNDQFLPGFTTDDRGDTLSVLTCNIYGNAKSRDRRELFETLKQADADLVFLTEYNPQSDPSLFRESIGGMYPYMISNRSKDSWRSGEVIYSRYPLRSHMDEYGSDEHFVIGDVLYKGKTLTLINVHFARLVRGLSQEQSNENSLAAGVERSVKYAQLKERQAGIVLSLIDTAENPVILCGDLNDTPNSRICHEISMRLSDVFADTGCGMGGTFGSARLDALFDKTAPLLRFFAHDYLRIDFIFAGQGIKALDARVLKDASVSDHKPLVARFRM